MGKILVIVCTLTLLLGLAPTASADPIAEIDRIRDGELITRGIELKKGGEVDFEAIGMRQPQSRSMAVYAWLLDHDTRDVVWSMTIGNSQTDRRSFLRKSEDSKFLEAGKYELYMHAVDQWHYGTIVRGVKDFYDVLSDLLTDDDDREWRDWDDRDWEEYQRDCFVRLTSDELTAADIGEFNITGKHDNALVQFSSMGDDEYIKQGFKVDRAMNIRIYSVLEHPRGNKTPVDYGWIINNDTRERVWEVDRWNTERAGGGRKNRKFDDEVRFEPGSYTLHFVTDDSHSWERFNMNPPWDPAFWGVTLLPGTDFQASAFQLVDVSDERGKALIDLTRARDNDFMERAFEIKRPCKLRAYCIGEYSDRDDDFVDYGWIEDGITGETVWDMTFRHTEHAGGGEKNRMFDGPIDLKPGKYIAYYVTDDSHAYRDWNTGRPFDDKAYGLALYPGQGFDNDDLVILKEGELFEGSEYLARIDRVRDRARRREEFTLDKDSKVRIAALGEGQDRRMYDYGWIEDEETGRVVWEMTWRRTDHAGGADKNRMVNDVITLDAGTYRVYYESDGSHSFGDWNSTPPRKPQDWGITVTRVD